MTCREQKKISSGLGEMWKGLEMEENEKRKVVRYVSLILTCLLTEEELCYIIGLGH